jgi:hypothetical protein
MENPTILITFHPDTLELDITAPELALDIVISFLERALRQCENAEKIVVAQNLSAAVRGAAENQQRTHAVLSKLKM